MSSQRKTTNLDKAAVRTRRLEATHVQAIEDNPLTADEIAMFEMFDREGWSHDRRRAYILKHLGPLPVPDAAE